MWISNEVDPPVVLVVPIELSQGHFLQLHLQLLVLPLKIYDDRVEEVDLMSKKKTKQLSIHTYTHNNLRDLAHSVKSSPQGGAHSQLALVSITVKREESGMKLHQQDLTNA